jgi:hypothetical protein
VPESSSLLISVGLRDRPGASSHASEAASGLLQLVGLSKLPSRSVDCERLVLIRPRWIVLEEEERLRPAKN